MNEKTHKTCEELMLEPAQGNRSAFTGLFNTTLETAPGCASDALRTRDELRRNDVAQEAWIGIMPTARNDSKDRGVLFETWFRTVVIRKALTMGRDEARRNVRWLTAGDEPAAHESVDMFMVREDVERALEAVTDEDDRLAYTLTIRRCGLHGALSAETIRFARSLTSPVGSAERCLGRSLRGTLGAARPIHRSAPR